MEGPKSVNLMLLRYAIVLSLLHMCHGGRKVSIASILARKKPGLLVQGLNTFHHALVGHSPLTKECHTDLVKFATASATGQQWAVKMLDSDGQMQSGVINGNYHWIGEYEQCMSVKASGTNISGIDTAKHDFDGRYCRVFFYADKTVLSVAVCVPSTCNQSDIQILLSIGNDSLPVYFVECSIKMDFWRDGKAVTTTIVLLFFGVLILVATFVDIYKSRRKHPPASCIVKDGIQTADTSVGLPEGDELSISHIEAEGSNKRANDNVNIHSSLPLVTIRRHDATPPRAEPTSAAWRALLAFSLYRNVPQILSARHEPGSYTCLHGIRVILAAWIVLGHTFLVGIVAPLTAMNYAAENPSGYYKLVTKFEDQVLVTFNLAVDGFFLLSAALVTVSFSKHLSRQVGMPRLLQMVIFYIHRYLRLTPAYAVVIMLTVGYYRYVVVGPIAPETDMGEPCRQNWWTLLLYIDNFVEYYRICVGWTWYLTLDFQFYVIAPLFIWLLYRFPIFGGLFLFLGYTGSLTARLVIFRENLTLNEWAARVYVRPWTRFGPYAIGIALGMIMYRTKCRIRMPKVVVAVGWLVAVSFLLAAVYGQFGLPAWPTVSYYAYMSTYRDVFALSVAWVVFACCSGYGGFVHQFLSWNFFIPLSRLTYTLYLIHPLIMYSYTYGLMQLIYVQYSTMVVLFLAYWLLGNMVAVVLSASFELPFMELEKVILSRKRA